MPPGKESSWVDSRQFKVFSKPSLGGPVDVLMEPTKDKVIIVQLNSPLIGKLF